MDDLERLVQTAAVPAEAERECKYAERGAREAWDLVTGLPPAYVTVLDLRHGINKSEYLVEIDGVRIKAFHTTAVGAHRSHYWDLHERFIQKSDLNLRALFNPRVLKRRRKRLRKLGLYNG